MAKSTQRKVAGPAQRRARGPDKRLLKSHHASRQAYREQDEIAAKLMVEDETVDLWGPEASIDEHGSLEEMGFDSEVALTDEDDVPQEETVSDRAADHFARNTLVVVYRGRAHAQPPDWDLGRPASDHKEERSLRFAMLGRVVAWLNAERADFLREPISAANPDLLLNFSLGRTNLNGPIPVMEEGLFEATGCSELGDFSTFHRHLRHVALKWSQSHYLVPASDLLSHRSRIAWVAAAIIDLKRERTINLELLRGAIAVPQGKDSDDARAVFRRIPAKNPRTAAPSDYAVAACLKVKVAWEKVVELYGPQIFKTEPASPQ
jgi:hypothetical protein